jgi:hypothetical protein
MTMSRRYTFLLCFAVSLLPWVAINLWGYIAALRCCEGDTVMPVGFPAEFYTAGSWVLPDRIMWDGLAVNAMFAIGISLVSAKILQSVFRPT